MNWLRTVSATPMSTSDGSACGTGCEPPAGGGPPRNRLEHATAVKPSKLAKSLRAQAARLVLPTALGSSYGGTYNQAHGLHNGCG